MNSPAITLRPARALDAGALGAMMSEAVHDTPWKPTLHSGAEDIAHAGQMIDHGWVTVAEIEGQTAGFLAREDGYIHSLFVARDCRRAGIASALLDTAKSACEQLTLWTFQANAAARKLYTSHNFTEVARTDGDNDEGLPDIHFQWRAERTAQ